MNQKDIKLKSIKIYIKYKKIDIKKEKIKISKTFKEGDLICCANNFIHNSDFYMTANDYDVENYSGKNGYYLIKENV